MNDQTRAALMSTLVTGKQPRYLGPPVKKPPGYPKNYYGPPIPQVPGSQVSVKGMQPKNQDMSFKSRFHGGT